MAKVALGGFHSASSEVIFESIGTPVGKKYLVEVLGATHFDGITCAAADGFFRPAATYMPAQGASGLSNAFAGIYDSLCLNQTDISSDEVAAISIRHYVAFFKVYLTGDGRYKRFLTLGDALNINLQVIFNTSDGSAHDTSNLPAPKVDDLF